MPNYFTSPADLKAWVISRPSAQDAAQAIMGMLGGKAQEQQSIFDTCKDIVENKNDKASDTLYGVLAMHNVVTLQKQAGDTASVKTAQSQSRQRNGWVRGMRNKWNRVVDGFNDGTPWRIDRDKMYNFTHYYTDAISFDEDPTRVYSGEALWRAYIMDKYSTEYRDQKTGHLVGGYINNRFYVFPDAGTPANSDAPRDGGNPMALTLGERSRKPRPHQWSVERRLEDARGNETYDLEATASTKQMVKTAGTIVESKLPAERVEDKVYNILRDTIEMREAGIEYADMIQKISDHYGASITGVAQIDVEAQRLLQKHEGVMYDLHKTATADQKKNAETRRCWRGSAD